MDPQKKPFSSSNEPTDSAPADSADESNNPLPEETMGVDADAPDSSDAENDSDSSAPDASSDSSEAPAAPDDAQPSTSTMDADEAAAAAILAAAPPKVAGSAVPAPAASATPVAAPAPDVAPAPAPSTPATGGDSASVLGMAPDGAVVSPKKNKKPMLIALIVAVLVVVLLGASAAAYFVVMNKPQNVLNMALLNSFSTEKVQSVSFDGSLDIKPKGSTTISTTYTGAMDKGGAFSFTGKVDALVTTVTVDARSADGNTFYVRVGGLSGLANLLGLSSTAPETTFLTPIINGLNNQWIQINQSMIKQITGSDTTVTTKFSADDRKKLEGVYKKHQFLVVNKTLKDETIVRKKSHHYQITIEKAKLKEFATALKDANIQSMKLDATSLRVFNDGADKTDFSKYPVDIWIAKDNKMVDQVSFTASQSGTTTSLRFTVDDYNKPLNVVVPTDSKSILDIISNLLGGASGASDLNSLSGISL
jgi:hypothetical protein